MSTQFSVSPDKTRIGYDITGNGPVLVLLHGAGKTRRDWHKQGYVARLKQGYTVVTVDLRGTGESDCPPASAEYAIEKICADVYAVADICHVGRFAVWGYSLGGMVARYLGAWSDRVTAIAMVGAPFGPAVEDEFDRYITEMTAKWKLVVQSPSASATHKRKPTLKGQMPALLTCFQAMRDWPSIQPGDVGCPTLLLAGDKHKRMMHWINANRPVLQTTAIHVEIIRGLNHPQEFCAIDQVFPPVSAFFKTHV
jgi:pimeloyl-ACP methyl ester carboxylesterase